MAERAEVGGTVREWPLDRPIDLPRTLGPLRRGTGDPTMRVEAGRVIRASLTPAGPATLALSQSDDGLRAQAWGPGAEWALQATPGLVGLDEAPGAWVDLELSAHPGLAQTRRRHPNLRLGRTGLVLESLVPAVLEQRVTGGEAWRAWRALVRGFGQPAPGPAQWNLTVMPSASRLLAVPSWQWHQYGVDSQRWRTIRAVATVASRLEECPAMAPADGELADFERAVARLRVVPGVGEWTAAETALRSLGHPDAVSVGDFHLKNLVGFALTGASRTEDATMVELLEPWRGQRARIVRLIELSAPRPPKFGPRFSPNDIRAI
ncbi:MAG: DNA-3-methyladenine glycosylase 2 family protein [Frankiales bacterium]|jgi:3-methyladenine DNA glycosylase/8-oxoguanine DNA glycosylase|nr:DNA-3-methyladenine glycosylase 2 family protein [Frankiales bacterium]